MSALIGMLASIWPALVGAIGVLAGLIFGYVNKKAADARVAQAGQKVAEANAATEQAKAQTATVRDAEAQANAAAAQAGAQSIKERANVENDVASLPAGSAAVQLRNEWSTGAGGADPARSTGENSDR
jgi:hypothetical protein